tara:strand:- start:2915 stop:3025 length:111 start_codon:yes stop_codon:yes gene_type:complete
MSLDSSAASGKLQAKKPKPQASNQTSDVTRTAYYLF